MSSTERHEQPPSAASQNGVSTSEDESAGAGLIGMASLAPSSARPFEDSKDLLAPEDIVTPDKQKESVSRYFCTNNMEDVSGVFPRNRRRYSDSDIKIYPRAFPTQSHISPTHLLGAVHK